MMSKRFVFIFFSIISWTACNSQPWAVTDNLRKKCMLDGRYDSALYYANEVIALVRGIKGENNGEYATALNNIASANFYLGNYTKAKYFILNEVRLRESLKADNDKVYLASLENASVICRRAGDYEEAFTQIKKAEKKSLRLYGQNNPGYARTLAYTGQVYYDMGVSVNDMFNLKKSEEYFSRAEMINSVNSDKAAYHLMLNKTDKAAFHNDIGNIPAAESLLKEVISFTSKTDGAESLSYAAALNNLGVLYFNSGDYKLAEKCFVEAADIYTGSLFANKIQSGICINNLGALYHEMGNYKIAGKMISDAGKIFESDHQQNSLAYAVLLNNLASVYISEEYYANADSKNPEHLKASGKLLLKADSLFTVNCPNQHPDAFAIKSNLSLWYLFSGEKEKAIKMLTNQALESGLSLNKITALMNKMPVSSFIPVSPVVAEKPIPEPMMIPVKVKLQEEVAAASVAANSVETDAVTNKLLEWILGKATNLKKAVGEYHPAYKDALKALIVSYAAFDHVTVEEELTLEYNSVINHKTLQDFSFLSESEKELYYQTRLPDVHSFTAYSLRRKRENPAITCHTYNNILLNKGLMLKSSTAMRVAILNSNDAALLKSYDEWIKLQKEISALYSTPVDLRTRNISELEKKANDIERQLVTKSQDFSNYRNGLQVSWEDVRKNLKADEAAIEFTDFKRKEKDGGNEVIYAALILRNDSKYPEMIKMFNEEQLKEILGNTGTADPARISNIYKAGDDRIYDLVWKPLEPFLKGIKNVYISPSGLLFRVSFPAISHGTNTYLCDNYLIQLKGSTGNILAPGPSIYESPSALIFGGIKYSNEESESQVWSYLEGTKSEAEAINNILSQAKFNVRYLSSEDATETFFKQNAGKFNYLHLATHGFFFDDPNKIKFEEDKPEIEYGEVAFRGGARGFGVNSFVNSENPLMRSGLVLAGANDVWFTTEKPLTDDGVLTAQEVTQIDMRRNNLVVLSACETGLGDIKGTEGVYGLQRALKMAGVRNIIMSLWEIPDKETVEFMGKFYESLLKLKDIKPAFAEAQHEMRLKYDPYYWGAFVLME